MRHRIMLGLVAIGILISVWLLANVVYAWRNAHRQAAWESGIQRGPDGVRAGCEPAFRDDGAPALLLVHGFADSPRLWASSLPALEAAGLSYRALRLPGFQEPADEAANVSAEQWLDAVESQYNELAAQHDSVWVVAHSLGCAITLSLVREKRIEPAGLVLYAPLIRVSSVRSPVLSSRTWHELGKGLLFLPKTIESVFPVDAWDPEVQASSYRDVFVPKTVHDALFAVTDRLPAGDGSYIHCPLLQFVSRVDKVVDVESAVSVFDSASSPRKRVVYTESAGHVLPLDYDWDERLALTIAFVQNADDGHD